MKRRFEDKVVLVTGAAGGIGLATARAFSAEGAKVMLADRDGVKLHAAEELIREEGGDAASLVVDVTATATARGWLRRCCSDSMVCTSPATTPACHPQSRPSRSNHSSNGGG
ncbi:TPA: SDR family NAD(P)-dependent oxidoreductase [Pseudomonas putida]|nr:SDR family NAD(P)-dependent oxidoreductase [Pseudomonas putida]